MVGRRRQAARGGRSQPRNGHVPDVYQEMLAEVDVGAQRIEVPERPLKRRRAGQNPEDIAEDTSEEPDPGIVEDEIEDGVAETSFQDVELPNVAVQTMEKDTDDEEDEDVEFEDVAFEAWLNGAVSSKEEETPQDLEINLSAHMSTNSPTKRTVQRRRPLTKEEKEKRLQIHQTHLLCLLSHVARRNHWCNDPEVQESLVSHLTDKTITYLTPGSNLPQFGRTNSLKTGLGQAGEMWATKFEITERGLRRALWAEEPDHLEHYNPPDDMDSCIDRTEFREAAKKLQGSRDVGVQLYCALLRGVGVRARLVCSLQPLACNTGAPTLQNPKQKKQGKNSGEGRQHLMRQHEERARAARAEWQSASGPPTPRRRLGHPNAMAYDFEPPKPAPKKIVTTFDTSKTIKESSYPVYWVEVLDVGHQKWQPVDPVVTHTFWKTKVFEPPITDRENSLTYVVAFEADGTARDVTKRYAKAYTAKTRKLRIETSTEGGDKWWRKAMKPFRRHVPEDLDQIEDNELAGIEAREPMPRNVQDFKDHPVYALERHLRRNEVLIPDAKPSGTVGAGSKAPLEKVYRRKDVRIARSEDKWYRLGREVKPNEIPAKWLPKRAQPRDSKLDLEEGDAQADDAGTPVYTQDQTELYISAPVRKGIVPKNKFGNIDLYVPSMVPRGGIHVRNEHAARAAFTLGIDYAPALTGFSFKGRQGTAVLDGIVVASEYGEAIEATIAGFECAEEEVENERRRLRALKAWRKMLMGLRIRERVWAGVDEGERREAEEKAIQAAKISGGDDDDEYEEEMRDAPSDVTEEFEMEEDDYGGGGFLVE